MKPILYESTVINAFLKKLMVGFTSIFVSAIAAAEFTVSSDDAIVIVGKARPSSHRAPVSFTVTATKPIVISGTKPLRPASFTTTSMNSVIIVGVNPSNPLTPTSKEADNNQTINEGASRYIAPASFSVTAANPIVIRGLTPAKLSRPASFNVTANTPIIIQGVSPKKQSGPASFSVTSSNAITILGTQNAENPSSTDSNIESIIESNTKKTIILPKAGSAASGKQGSKKNNGNRQTPSAAALHFIPLVSLVQVTPLAYRGEFIQPFEPDTVVEQVNDRIAERREAVDPNATGGDSTGGGTGSSSGGSDGGDSTGGGSGGGFMATSLPVSGPLPINSTDGQINLDYNPSGTRSLRVFNEDSTSPMPIRRVLTTSGVSAGAVQINIDDDYFSVHSRVPASDVISAPGGQTIIVRDYSDNNYLQIQITVGSANFFGDHAVENIVGWFCGADPADCPL